MASSTATRATSGSGARGPRVLKRKSKDRASRRRGKDVRSRPIPSRAAREGPPRRMQGRESACARARGRSLWRTPSPQGVPGRRPAALRFERPISSHRSLRICSSSPFAGDGVSMRFEDHQGVQIEPLLAVDLKGQELRGTVLAHLGIGRLEGLFQGAHLLFHLGIEGGEGPGAQDGKGVLGGGVAHLPVVDTHGLELLGTERPRCVSAEVNSVMPSSGPMRVTAYLARPVWATHTSRTPSRRILVRQGARARLRSAPRRPPRCLSMGLSPSRVRRVLERLPATVFRGSTGETWVFPRMTSEEDRTTRTPPSLRRSETCEASAVFTRSPEVEHGPQFQGLGLRGTRRGDRGGSLEEGDLGPEGVLGVGRRGEGEGEHAAAKRRAIGRMGHLPGANYSSNARIGDSVRRHKLGEVAPFLGEQFEGVEDAETVLLVGGRELGEGSRIVDGPQDRLVEGGVAAKTSEAGPRRSRRRRK